MITSNPDPDKPLTWNVPEWFAMSCYINSALWGLLYNSSFTKVIQDVDTSILVENVVYLADTTKTNCSPAVFDNLKQSLLDYQKGILDSSVKMKPKLEEIRQIFKTCSSDKTTDWNSEVGDPSIVVNIIDELFSPKSVPLNLDNFVTYQETVNQIVSSSSKVKDDQLKLLKKFNEEGTKPKINKTFYKKIATIKISKNENGDLPKITNKTNSSGKEEIIVEQISNNIESTFATINNAGRKIDDDPFLKDIDYDERKTVKETVTDASGQTTKIPKEYVYVNTKSETISTYTLNNNSGGIIIEYSQEQSNKQGNGLVSNEEMWEILDNNIQEKYYQIGKYVLSAFVCWTSSGHYTCYFRFKDEWFVMNDYPKPGTIIKIDFTEPKDKKTFQHKLFRNSILFFYELDTNLIETDTKYCSVEFNYDINVERAELASAPKSSSSSSAPKSTTTSSAQRTTLPKGQTTTPKGQTTTPKKTVQTVDKCEKYGEEWLNLFIAENAVSGSTKSSITPDGTRLLTYTDQKTGIRMSVTDADENCTFVQSNGLTKSATASVPSIGEKADQALEDAQKLQIANSVVSNRVTNAKKGNNDTDITPYNQGNTPNKGNLDNNLIYFNNFVYVVGYLESEPNVIKLYKVEDNTVCDLDGTNCNPYNDNSNKFTLFDPPSTAASNSGSDPLIGRFYINKDNIIKEIKSTQNVNYVTDNNITTYTEDEAKVAQAANQKIKDEEAQAAAEAKLKATEAEKQRREAAEAQAQIDANAALENAKKKTHDNNIINIELSTKSNTDIKIVKNPIIGTYSSGDIIYNINTPQDIYMIVNIGGQFPRKYLNLINDLLYDASFKELKQQQSYTLDTIVKGGTRRKRNRNTNGGTRKGKGKGKRHLRKTHKLRKGRRTRKHIRHKNKLKTNKLRTRKHKLNKRKTRKAL